jgi:Flp pilus assembly pilin Flp
MPAMTKLLHRFMLCRQGVTAIEYALIASGIALTIVTAVSAVGVQWRATFFNIANSIQ